MKNHVPRKKGRNYALYFLLLFQKNAKFLREKPFLCGFLLPCCLGERFWSVRVWGDYPGDFPSQYVWGNRDDAALTVLCHSFLFLCNLLFLHMFCFRRSRQYSWLSGSSSSSVLGGPRFISKSQSGYSESAFRGTSGPCL